MTSNAQTRRLTRQLQFTKKRVKLYMFRNLARAARDRITGEVCMTTLAEMACEDFGQKHSGGPLDDPEHWIWEAALEADEAIRRLT